MNPAMSGISVAALVIMSLIIIVLALALIKAHWPTSKAGQLVGLAQTDLRQGLSEVESIAGRVAPKFVADVHKAEDTIEMELSSLLEAAETKLMDTSGEDAMIRQADADLAAQTKRSEAVKTLALNMKSQKLKALDLHAARLQAHAASLRSLPSNGS